MHIVNAHSTTPLPSQHVAIQRLREIDPVGANIVDAKLKHDRDRAQQRRHARIVKHLVSGDVRRVSKLLRPLLALAEKHDAAVNASEAIITELLSVHEEYSLDDPERSRRMQALCEQAHTLREAYAYLSSRTTRSVHVQRSKWFSTPDQETRIELVLDAALGVGFAATLGVGLRRNDRGKRRLEISAGLSLAKGVGLALGTHRVRNDECRPEFHESIVRAWVLGRVYGPRNPPFEEPFGLGLGLGRLVHWGYRARLGVTMPRNMAQARQSLGLCYTNARVSQTMLSGSTGDAFGRLGAGLMHSSAGSD